MKTLYIVFLLVFSFSFSTDLISQTLTVNSNGDTSDALAGDGNCDDGSGNCTLRAAIEEANANATITTINFNAGMTIAPASALPAVSRANLTIDAITGTGGSCGTLVTGTAHTLQVVIDGSSLPISSDGLTLTANGIMVQGLVIQNCTRDGISMNGLNIMVQCCYIGTSQAGNAAAANGRHGIVLSSFDTGISIKNSLLSGNTGNGLHIGIAAAATVSGNLIGTDASGTSAVANDDGIESFGAIGCTIGGTAASDRNIISGNNNHGFNGGSTGSHSNAFYGNYIGTDINGTADLGNGGSGIFMHNGNDTYTIGGAATGEGNVISGNGGNGLQIRSSTVVLGNKIGTDASGTSAIGNDGHGVFLHVSANNCTVGNISGGGNTIAFNGSAGIAIANPAGSPPGQNVFRGNSIFNNTGLGIDLNEDGATANDINDADTGPNQLQNCPELSAVMPTGSDMSITFSVPSSTSNSAYDLTIDFYIADAAMEEGQTYIGSVTYTSAEAGTAVTKTFTPVTAVSNGAFVLSTATDANGNTSEFSAAQLLPVELTFFRAKASENNVQLLWQTASETNNEGFEIQHNTSGDWQSIGFVKSLGEGAIARNYHFLISDLPVGSHYFRLKQMDWDGQYTFSQVEQVNITGGVSGVTVTPNPIRDVAQINLVLHQAEEISVQLIDMQSHVIHPVLTGYFEKGNQQLSIDSANLPNGVYVLVITGENGWRKTERIVVAK